MLHAIRLVAVLIVFIGLLAVPSASSVVAHPLIEDKAPNGAGRSTNLNRSPVISRVQTNRPIVAITVDDFYTGDYNRLVAEHMLQAANAANVALTLCPAGSALVGYSRLHQDQAAEIQRLVAAGHYELCNHTYSHPILTRVGDAFAQAKEIMDGQAVIERFFGRTPSKVFRPPYGSWNVQTQEAAALAGYPKVVTWSIDSGDSEGPELPAQLLLADVACAQPGDIILMHANRRSSAQALPLIIAMLRQRGLEPVTLSTLLDAGTPVYSYSPADMRRLYTCVRRPIRPTAPSRSPVVPQVPPVVRPPAPVAPTRPAAPVVPVAPVAPAPIAQASPSEIPRISSQPNRDPDAHNNPETRRQ